MSEDVNFLLDQLDNAILLFAPELDALRVRNAAADELLDALGMRGEELPDALISTVEHALVSASGARFSPPVLLPTPRGPRYLVRARRLPSARGILTLATPAAPRDHELADTLFARYGLSRRDSRIVALVRSGLSNVEIAREMNLRSGTIRQYMSSIFSTLGVHSRTQLICVVDAMRS